MAKQLDFDNFDEDAALEDVSALVGVKTIFGDGWFRGKFANGDVVSVPLEIPRQLIDGIDTEGLDTHGQVVALLTALGLGEDAERLAEQSWIASMVFATKFFETIEKIMKASMGKFSM